MAQNLFNQVKKIVGHIGCSHQQQILSKKLISYSDTRFNSGLIMNNFRELFVEIPLALIDSNLITNYNLVDKDLLDSICTFLNPFEEMIESLSEDRRPTLHRVIPLRQYVINTCKMKENDCSGIAQLKVFFGKKKNHQTYQWKAYKFSFVHFMLLYISIYQILARHLNNSWPITDEHRLAVILCPKLKNFECSPKEQEKSINVLKQEFANQSIIYSGTKLSNISDIDVKSSSTSLKRKNLSAQCFDAKVHSVNRRNQLQEVDDMDNLLFWKEQQKSFPILSELARKISAIPASNTIVEQVFSSSKTTVTENQTRLGTS
ncbi:unnamed protein product [Adineta ricciae]|nr:unnamed protein product [Adineta ricciae]